MKIYNQLLILALGVGATQSAHSSRWPTGTPDNVTVSSGQRIFIPVLKNDSGQGLSLIEVNTTTVALGSVQMNASRTALYYTSKTGFTGKDSFWYAFQDKQGRTNSTQVFLNVTSRPRKRVTTSHTSAGNKNYSGWPVATEDRVKVSANSSVSIPVLDNDVGDRLKLIEVNDWTVNGGRASIAGNNVVYRPKQDYVGQDSFWYNFIDARGRKNSTQVKVTITSSSITEYKPAPRAAAEGRGRGNAGAVYLPMHVDFLKNQRFIWGEVGGTQSMQVVKAADAGSTQLNVSNGFTLKDNQLITYLATDGDYYTVATGKSSATTVNLRTPLPQAIASGGTIWNFYNDGSHPNTIGLRSLTDFALRNNNLSALDAGKHVMLGDSWFSTPGIKERLTEKLPGAQIINKGVGGNTSANMLERFDTDVASLKPDVVWLMAGTNDYFQRVSVEAYAANMKKLIRKINAIGAKAMVFDTSVAQLMSGSNALTEVSHQYARAVSNLLNR